MPQFRNAASDGDGEMHGEQFVTKKLEAVSHVGFLMLEKFSMIAFASAIETLRMANYLSGKPLYSWSIITPDGQPVRCSNGLASSDTVTYDASPACDLVLVCGGVEIDRSINDRLRTVLRHIARDGVMLGGLCTGSYALVKAGLLDGYRCTIHWEHMASLREAFPRVSFQEDLFVIDRDRLTCTGGIAPIHLILALVRARFGKTLVAEISDQFILERVRDSKDHQHIPIAARLGVNNRALVKVANLMESHFEEPLSAVELAKLAGLSLRQVQRMFHESLNTTPTKYYLRLRLRRARELLIQSDMSVTEIAVACGFQSICHFSKSYKQVYGRAPRVERRNVGLVEESAQGWIPAPVITTAH